MSPHLNVHSEAKRKAVEETEAKWRKAAAEKRIKTQKQRGRDLVKVSIVEVANHGNV